MQEKPQIHDVGLKAVENTEANTHLLEQYSGFKSQNLIFLDLQLHSISRWFTDFFLPVFTDDTTPSFVLLPKSRTEGQN